MNVMTDAQKLAAVVLSLNAILNEARALQAEDPRSAMRAAFILFTLEGIGIEL